MTGATCADPPALVVTPEAHHGVAVLARDVARAVSGIVGADLAVPVETLVAEAPPARAHLHFTDRLWASSPEQAAARIVDLAGRTRLTVTLHDLPQPSDGERNLPRRSACYARVVAASAGVVVNSHHEAALLREHTIRADVPVGVVPLPVTRAGSTRDPGADARPDPDGTLGVLGFFYPGKGHAEVVRVAADIGRGGSGRAGSGPIGVTVLGRASDGHEDELATLVADAAERGVRLEVTGWLDDDALLERCSRVAVPVAAHQHVSASGSIASWIAAGRRPLVPDTRYSREMSALRPGTLTLVADGRLDDAVARAIDDPASTWIDDDAVTGPDLDDTARAYLRWFQETTP